MYQEFDRLQKTMMYAGSLNVLYQFKILRYNKLIYLYQAMLYYIITYLTSWAGPFCWAITCVRPQIVYARSIIKTKRFISKTRIRTFIHICKNIRKPIPSMAIEWIFMSKVFCSNQSTWEQSSRLICHRGTGK